MPRVPLPEASWKDASFMGQEEGVIPIFGHCWAKLVGHHCDRGGSHRGNWTLRRLHRVVKNVCLDRSSWVVCDDVGISAHGVQVYSEWVTLCRVAGLR